MEKNYKLNNNGIDSGITKLIDQLSDSNTFNQVDSLLSSFVSQPKEFIFLERSNIQAGLIKILNDEIAVDILLLYLDNPLGFQFEPDSNISSERNNNFKSLITKYNIFFCGFLKGRTDEWRTISMKSIFDIAAKEAHFLIEISKMSNTIVAFESSFERLLPLLNYMTSNFGNLALGMKSMKAVDQEFFINTIAGMIEILNKIMSHLKDIKLEQDVVEKKGKHN
jgi:hypothetical protein